jgi:protein O-mannosyl-transferase
MKKNSPWIPAFLLIILTIGFYSPALQADFTWDDPENVINNMTLRSVQGLKDIWLKPGATYQYHPTIFTSFWAEHQIWGLDPFYYHLNNIILHLINAFLLFFILSLLRVPGAFIAASFFSLHPVHVESVAWITERKNVLSLVFFLSSILVYLYYESRNNNKQKMLARPLTNSIIQNNIITKILYFSSLFLFFVALISKHVTCSMPAAMLLILWWKNGRISWKNVKDLIPFFLIGLAMAINSVIMEKNLGASGEEWSYSLLERTLIAGRAPWFYVSKLIWPFNICFIYPRWKINVYEWSQYGYLFATIGTILILWYFRKKISNTPLIVILLFGGTLIPALGFFDVYFFRFSFVQDHFQYLSSIVIITLCASGFYLALSFHKPTLCILHSLLLLTFGVIVWHECHKFENQETLWRDTIKKNPSAAIANANLGKILYQEKKYDEAMSFISKALQLNPLLYEAQNNMGGILLKKGRYQEAAMHFQEAIQIKPSLVQAYVNLGLAFIYIGKIDEAILEFKKAITIQPSFQPAQVYLNKAMIFKHQKAKSDNN